MSALDYLLAKSLSLMIIDKLGKKSFQKIEKRLKERYDISVIQAIGDFQKMDATLREFFGPAADDMEKDFLNNFISFENNTKQEKSWIVIEDQNLANLILESFGNSEKKLILDSSLKQPNVILDILDSCNMPKSSGYRIIKDLIKDGLLTKKGYATTQDGKRVNKYTSIFKNIKIEIQEGKTLIKVQLDRDLMRESFLLKVI